MARQATRKKQAAAPQVQPSAAAQSAVDKVGDESGQDAIALLAGDHRKVEQIFRQFEGSQDSAEKEQLARQACTELIVHTMLEEEIFYPACRAAGVESEMLDEAQVEHDGAKVLIIDIQHAKAGDEFYDAKVKVLSDYIRHHLGEEEKSDGIFAKAKLSSMNLDEVGSRIRMRKQALMQQTDALQEPRLRSIEPGPIFRGQQRTLSNGEEDQMYRNSNDRERDSQGRFESEDRGRRSRSGSSRDYRSSGDYEEENGHRGGGGRGWYGDSEGHREAAEERWEGRSGSQRGHASRDRDEDSGDEGRYGSRGGGRGWFGDSEGHREAAEARWEGRRGGAQRGYASRGRDDDDEGRSGSRGHGGWFGDSEGHREAAEARWEGRSGGERRAHSAHDRDEDRDNGRGRSGSERGRGWFGDPEGHREAAEARWESRGGSSRRGDRH